MWRVFRFLIDAAVVLAVIMFLPGLPPYGKLQSYEFAPTKLLEGGLAPNDILNYAEKLFDGNVRGPEAFAVSQDDPSEMYTGLGDGSIAKITGYGKKVEPVARFGERSTKYWEIEKSGRPLGIRYDHSGKNLIVADAYLGIYRLDPRTGKYEQLVRNDQDLNGKPAKIFNSVVEGKDGKIYWTDSSSNYPLHEGVGEMLGSPSGRLFCYDPSTKKNELLIENLHFANGVALSPNEDFVLVVETFQFRIMKYWLTGPNKGKSEIFIDGLPGNPDNLSLSPEGNILLGLITVRFPNEWNPAEFLGRQPLLRKLLLRIMHFVKAPLDLAARYIGVPLAKQLSFHILNMETVSGLTPPYAIIAELDWNGKILRSWHSNTKSARFFSEGAIAGDYMFLGSPFNDYLGRVKLNED